MAHFPRELLAEHEDIRLELRPHWMALIRPIFWTNVSLVILIVRPRCPRDRNAETGLQQAVAVIALVVWIVGAVIPFLRLLYTLFVLTTDRLITRSGIIAKRSKEIPLERINDVAFTQSVLERLLG